jgi:hypothetical protein
MPRLLWSLVFSACGLFVVAYACAAPAPFPKTGGTTDPLFLRMKKAVNVCGFDLHEMRPGARADEYVLVISARNPDEPPEKAARVTTTSANVQQLLNPDVLEVIIVLALVKGGGELSLKERLGYPCRTLKH